MKKISLFVALAVAGMATAQVQVTPEKLELQKMEVKTIEMNKKITLEKWDAKKFAEKAASADYAGVDYYHMEGMMHGGLTPEWGGWGPMIMVPAYQSNPWINDMGPTTWTHPSTGEVWEENTDTLEGGYEVGLYYLPKTTDHVVTTADGDVSIKGYLYGSSKANQYLVAGSNHMVADQTIPMTLCGMYCDPIYGSNGSDFYAVSAQSLGCDYSYGTDLTYQGMSFDTISSVVRNINPMKINSLHMPIYHANDADLNAMLPDGAQVKVEICAADLAQGIIYTDSIYAETIISKDDCLDLGAGSATLVAYFYEEDIFGGLMQVSVLVPGDFVVQITGYNESDCNFGFITDYYTPGGTTLFTVNGNYTELWSQGSNLAIMYDAYWPVAANGAGSEVLVAPVEGGMAMDGEYEAIAILTNLMDPESEMLIEECPEWIEPILDASSYAETGYVVAQFETAALPAGETGRQGIVTIDADGYKLDIVINQGEVQGPTTGVENVVAPISNKTFNLLGVEVDENYKGIVIKNGQKTIQ